MRTVLLAGGRGRRLEPFTTILPKPLAPIEEIPIIEILIRQLRRELLTDITISLGYLGELIQSYLAHRSDLGVDINYVREHSPLGTAGALSLIDARGGDLLVINGDVLTDLRFGDVLDTHRESKAALTIAVQQRTTQIAFGVVESSDGFLTCFTEKPVIDLDCSIGVNVYAARALAAAGVDGTRPIDLPHVVDELLRAGERVAVHRHAGYWCDIGTRDDYERAQSEFGDRRQSILGDE